MNIGIGYHKAHNERSYVDLKTLYKQVNTFIEFFMEYKSTDFGKRDEPVNLICKAYDLYDYEDDLNICELCGYNYGVVVYGHRICSGCFQYMYSKEIEDRDFEDVTSDDHLVF